MQYGEELNTTKLTMRSDHAVAIASSRRGANLDAIGFNLNFIAHRRPALAIDLLRLYREAGQVKASDPPAADEDFLAAEADFQLVSK